MKITSCLVVAEVLGDREARETDAGAGARRLVHLTDHEGRLRDDGVAVLELRLLHLEVEVVALARPLADAREHRHAAVLLRDVVDELEDDDGLPDAGAAEEADLATALIRGEQVDDLHAGLEHLHLRRLLGERRRRAVDRVGLRRRDRTLLVDGLPDDVHDAAEHRFAYRHLDAVAGVGDVHAADEPFADVHRDGADGILAEVLGDLQDEVPGLGVDGRVRHREGVEDGRKLPSGNSTSTQGPMT